MHTEYITFFDNEGFPNSPVNFLAIVRGTIQSPVKLAAPNFENWVATVSIYAE